MKTEQNLHILQLAAERYATDDPTGVGLYPNSIGQAANLGYLPFNQLPENPYNGQPMHEVALGEQPVPGGYTYLTLKEEIAPGYVFPTAYLLVAYSRQGRSLKQHVYDLTAENYEKRFKEAHKIQWSRVCFALESGEDIGDPVQMNESRQQRFLKAVSRAQLPFGTK